MDTGVIVAIVVAALLLLVVLVLIGRRRREAQLEGRRVEAGEHRQHAKVRTRRAETERAA